MYQALYRKWRPQTFDEVIGQKHITETLKNQVKTDRLSHAYIFIGTRGTGKTTCARILARAVNCEHPVNGNPCGKCAACRGIMDGSVMDVVELDAASNNGVDNVRALREEAVFSPADVKKRVYIIDEVHMLSTAAFNALLKILEEPPEHLMFILATTELHKVPATILSRCQRHIFHRIDTPVIADYLREIADREHFRLTPQAAELIARLAEGGVRDALSLLDQCSAAADIDTDAVYSAMGLAGNRRISQMLSLILKHDTPAVLKEFSGMWMDGKDPATLLSELSSLLRDVLMLQVAPKGGLELISGGYDSDTLMGFAERMTREELMAALDIVSSSLSMLRDTKNPRTAVELCLVKLCSPNISEDIGALRARVSRLERKIEEAAVLRGPVPSNQSPRPSISPERSEKAPETLSPEPEYIPPEPGYVPVREPEPEHSDAASESPAEERLSPAVPEPHEQQSPAAPETHEQQSLEERAHLVETVPVMEGMEYNSPERDWDSEETDCEPDCGSFDERRQENNTIDAREEDEGPDDRELWPLVCRNIKVTMDVKTILDDERKVKGRAEGSELIVSVIPGFTYERINKPEILAKFRQTASELAGREMRVRLCELQEQRQAVRSLDELRDFPEVKFI